MNGKKCELNHPGHHWNKWLLDLRAVKLNKNVYIIVPYSVVCLGGIVFRNCTIVNLKGTKWGEKEDIIASQGRRSRSNSASVLLSNDIRDLKNRSFEMLDVLIL